MEPPPVVEEAGTCSVAIGIRCAAAAGSHPGLRVPVSLEQLVAQFIIFSFAPLEGSFVQLMKGGLFYTTSSSMLDRRSSQE